MEQLAIPFIAIFVLCTATPIPAIACFYAAWPRVNPETTVSPGDSHNRTLFVRFLLAIPTAVFPVALLALHAATSEPEWKKYGEGLLWYLALGPSAWVYLLPFAGANFVIARTIIDPDYLREWMLPPLCMVTCLLICLFFTLGNIREELMFIFPLSAGIAYACGLARLLQAGELPKRLTRHALLFVGWALAGVLTVLAGILKTRQMVADLPDEPPPQCFVVTAAARGHRMIVRTREDSATGRLTNGQLQMFRQFECWLREHAPAVQQRARAHYNLVGPIIARAIKSRWQADLMYLLLKPLEWILHVFLRSH